MGVFIGVNMINLTRQIQKTVGGHPKFSKISIFSKFGAFFEKNWDFSWFHRLSEQKNCCVNRFEKA